MNGDRVAVISLGTNVTHDLSAASSREWLETNGLGGWASSTVSGAHTRRYHGLLVAAVRPASPTNRRVLLSRLDETLRTPHEVAELGCCYFPGAVHPEGYRSLNRFYLSPFPTFEYSAIGVEVRKIVAAIHGENTVVIRYELISGPTSIQLELRPFFAGRDYHHLGAANDGVARKARFEDGVLEYRSNPQEPAVLIGLPGSRYEPAPDWYYNFQYPREAERGLDSAEDLFTPGVLRCMLEPDQPLWVIASLEEPAGRDPEALLEKERRRRESVPVPPPLRHDALGLQLARAADQFIVRRCDRGSTVIAGYHWFTDWGRDTMIALPGICLVAGRFAEARSILHTFARHISQGMVPNRFPEGMGDDEPDYNTVDATLWFFAALYRYLRYSGDFDLAREVWNSLKEVISWHRKGTRYGIRVADDGLLRAGEDGVQLTWMDAKLGDWVVTPRQGKPVEINALWYNALRTMAWIGGRLGEDADAADYHALADGVARQFEDLFWNEDGGCLYDVVDDDGRADSSVRPNQIFALSLPFPLFLPGNDRARRIFKTVDDQLFTPAGLRSLSSRDPAYRPHYVGPPLNRDGAYHQGTVWSWLLGPFITALVRLHGTDGRRRGRTILEGFESHLMQAGLGSISEIFDGDRPHYPRGCIAQAWSVGELLRAYCEDVLGHHPSGDVAERPVE